MTGPHRVLLGVPNAATGQQITAMIDEIDDAELVDTAESANVLLAALTVGTVDVVVLHADVGPLPVLEVAREVSTRHPQVGVVLLTGDLGSALLRSALAAGVRDVVALPVSFEELHASLTHTGRWSRSVRTRDETDDTGDAAGTASMLGIAGAKGGVGTSTVAVHLALALREQGTTVCLVDLELQTGDIRHLLDITHQRSIDDLLDVAEQITARQLDDSLYQHRSGLRVLLPPRTVQRAEEVTGAATRQILGALRSRFDVVVVDLGAVVSEAGAVAAHMASQLLVVTTPDVLALRSANRLLALWDQLGVRTGTGVLLNRADKSSEVQPDLVTKVADTTVLDTTLPACFRPLEAAVNTGDPERARSSPVRRAIDSLTVELGLASSPETVDRPSRRSARRLRPAREAGQVAIETVGMLPLLLVVIALLWQVVLVGGTFVLAEHAAREGARELAVGDDAGAAVLADLPRGWRSTARVRSGADRVDVTLAVPALVPGVPSPWTVTTSAGAIVEDTS